MFVPKLSAPLAKAIRTSEGILVWLTNLGLAVGALIDPSTLPPKEAAIVASAVTGLHVASRTLLKVTALQQGAGVTAPLGDTDLVGPPAAKLASKLELPLPVTAVDDATIEKIVSLVVKAADNPQAAVHSVEEQLVSDVEEFANQPPETAADWPRPESAVKPDPASAQVAVPMGAASPTTPADVAAQTVTTTSTGA